jgi:hypothetical protein
MYETILIAVIGRATSKVASHWSVLALCFVSLSLKIVKAIHEELPTAVLEELLEQV